MTTTLSAVASKPGLASRKKCLVPECERVAVRRGDCAACYMAFSREVKAKRTTWKKLENEGLVTVKNAPRSAAAKAIRKMKAKATAAASK